MSLDSLMPFVLLFISILCWATTRCCQFPLSMIGWSMVSGFVLTLVVSNWEVQQLPVTFRWRLGSREPEEMSRHQLNALSPCRRDEFVDIPELNPVLEIFQTLLQRNGLIDDDETCSFGSNSRVEWRLFLEDSDEENAGAYANGDILVTEPLIKSLANAKDQMAGIVGHEIAHVLLRHGEELVSYDRLWKIVWAAVRGLLMLGDGTWIDLSLTSGKTLGKLKVSRIAEFEADRVGQALAARSGFDPAKGMWMWLDSRWRCLTEVGVCAAKLGRLLEDHPPDIDRRNALSYYHYYFEELREAGFPAGAKNWTEKLTLPVRKSPAKWGTQKEYPYFPSYEPESRVDPTRDQLDEVIAGFRFRPLMLLESTLLRMGALREPLGTVTVLVAFFAFLYCIGVFCYGIVKQII